MQENTMQENTMQDARCNYTMSIPHFHIEATTINFYISPSHFHNSNSIHTSRNLEVLIRVSKMPRWKGKGVAIDDTNLRHSSRIQATIEPTPHPPFTAPPSAPTQPPFPPRTSTSQNIRQDKMHFLDFQQHTIYSIASTCEELEEEYEEGTYAHGEVRSLLEIL